MKNEDVNKSEECLCKRCGNAYLFSLFKRERWLVLAYTKDIFVKLNLSLCSYRKKIHKEISLQEFSSQSTSLPNSRLLF